MLSANLFRVRRRFRLLSWAKGTSGSGLAILVTHSRFALRTT